MANVNVGVVGQAELNSGMTSALGLGFGSNSGKLDAAMWSFIWFGAAVAFILFMYFGFGGLRGQVAS